MAMTDTFRPLGRTVWHDERSRAFGATLAPEIKTKTHRHYGAVLDQGNLGSCTGNAMAQALNTKPFKQRGRTFRQEDAVALYSRATQIDPWVGEYPPQDTGSSGLAVAKAAQERGWITGYRWAFGLDEALAALTLSPLLIGTNWYSSMFFPNSDGYVFPTGFNQGGHEYLLLGLDVRKQRVTALNSWGSGWGRKGRFFMTFDTLGTLLEQNGDVVVPVA
jgi:C1A family cysteine protease